MKFKCGKLQLANSLTNVQKAVAQRSTIAALEGVLITCLENKIELCGYNTEMGITTSLDALIQKQGKVVVNGHLFTEIIKKLPSETVEIEVNENLLIKISGGQSNGSRSPSCARASYPRGAARPRGSGSAALPAPRAARC